MRGATRERFFAAFVLAAVALIVGCGDRKPAPAGESAEEGRTPASEIPRAPVRVALATDGVERGALVATAAPVVLGRLVPPEVKPLSQWTRIHATSDSGRFVLVMHPSMDYRGQVPMLYVDERGAAVFVMVRAGSDGSLPTSVKEMRKYATPVILPDVSRINVWIDAEPPRPSPPEGQVVLRFGTRRDVLTVHDFTTSLGPETIFAGNARMSTGGRPDSAAASERIGKPGDGARQERGKPAGTPLGWSLAELLRKRVMREGDLRGIRVVPAEGEPVVIDAKWWTEKNRFLAVRPNRKGDVVVHGYVLGERAQQELVVQQVNVVEAIAEDGPRRNTVGGSTKRGKPRSDAR